MAAITATTPTNLRKNLFNLLDKVTEDDMQIIITMKSGKNAVLMSEDEANEMRGYKETEYLLRDPANRADLMQAIDDFENGRGRTMTIEEFRKEFPLE
ncbi:MAG: type II toxin-antitoxin system prevent-host-death family antitoxin [Streptococcaceae bacterium]|jgi:antitoxin YefM|nr:type II toxin-antitoxin system prevent-host-death family antitoxin [Streptococcaceae bacterium]